MRDAKDLLNLPVVVVDGGIEVGRVRNLLFEPGKHQLYGLIIDGKGDRPTMVLAPDRIGSIGENAVTISDVNQVSILDSDEKAQRLEKAGGHLGGMRVLTEGGDLIGKVDTVMLHDDGRIASYQATSGMLGLGGRTNFQPDQVVTAGEDAIIIATEFKRAD
jgi:uncharacterized protein YrrD